MCVHVGGCICECVHVWSAYVCVHVWSAYVCVHVWSAYVCVHVRVHM